MCILQFALFSELKVIERANDRISQSGRKIVMWKCLCSCGKYIEVRGDSLRRGHTKSCGHNRKNKKGNKYDLSGDYGVGYTYKNEPFYLAHFIVILVVRYSLGVSVVALYEKIFVFS